MIQELPIWAQIAAWAFTAVVFYWLVRTYR